MCSGGIHGSFSTSRCFALQVMKRFYVHWLRQVWRATSYCKSKGALHYRSRDGSTCQYTEGREKKVICRHLAAVGQNDWIIWLSRKLLLRKAIKANYGLSRVILSFANIVESRALPPVYHDPLGMASEGPRVPFFQCYPFSHKRVFNIRLTLYQSQDTILNLTFHISKIKGAGNCDIISSRQWHTWSCVSQSSKNFDLSTQELIFRYCTDLSLDITMKQNQHGEAFPIYHRSHI